MSGAADEPDDEFVFGLDRILDGVGALVEGYALSKYVIGMSTTEAAWEFRRGSGLE